MTEAAASVASMVDTRPLIMYYYVLPLESCPLLLTEAQYGQAHGLMINFIIVSLQHIFLSKP